MMKKMMVMMMILMMMMMILMMMKKKKMLKMKRKTMKKMKKRVKVIFEDTKIAIKIFRETRSSYKEYADEYKIVNIVNSCVILSCVKKG